MLPPLMTGDVEKDRIAMAEFEKSSKAQEKREYDLIHGTGSYDIKFPAAASSAVSTEEVNPFASTAPEDSFQAEFLKLQADNPGDPRYAGEVPDYIAPEEIQLGLDNPGDPRFYQGIMS